MSGEGHLGGAVRFLQLAPEWGEGLAGLFQVLVEGDEERYFHPHPLDHATAIQLAQYAGEDRYYVAIQVDRVVGYGLLRGWDEGYDVPSLGIAIHPAVRRTGLARRLMEFLHARALEKGARQIRLKVYPSNVSARRLYESLGYKFQADKGNQLLGILDLAHG